MQIMCSSTIKAEGCRWGMLSASPSAQAEHRRGASAGHWSGVKMQSLLADVNGIVNGRVTTGGHNPRQ